MIKNRHRRQEDNKRQRGGSADDIPGCIIAPVRRQRGFILIVTYATCRDITGHRPCYYIAVVYVGKLGTTSTKNSFGCAERC